MNPAVPLAALGRPVLAALASLGRVVLFAGAVVSHIFRPPFYPREFAAALLQIGWFSLPVVGLTAVFTGGALALQIYSGGARFNAEAVVPSIVAIGMARELGPVLGGLMVAARVASSIAAEIGTMKVTEQIDALVTLSTNPLKYLAVPRVLAATLAVPVLVGVGDAIGIMGGWLVGVTRLDFNSASYLRTTTDFLEVWDVGSGLLKGRGLRVYHRGDGLLSRHEFGAWRAGRGGRDQDGGRGGIGADPCCQLPADRGVLHLMIALSAVTKTFGPNRVLRGVNLTIPKGSSMVIIGGSGTGKSVLLKCILGLVRPDAGTISLDGTDVQKAERDAFLARFGMLFQGAALFDSLRVWENVAFRLMRGATALPKAQAREIAIEKLRRVGLTPAVADLYPAELSGGMQKRVGLARAIAAEPEIIFFDEPTTGLDPDHGRRDQRSDP